MFKITVLSMHPAPYRDPVFKELMNEKNIEVSIISLFNNDINHKEWNLKSENYRNTFLNRKISIGASAFHLDILKILKKEKFDILIIPGYYHITCILSILYCIFNNKKYIYAADSADIKMNIEKKGFKNRIIKNILKRAKAVWTTGEAGCRYMRNMGVSSDRIFKGYYTLNNKEIWGEIQNNKKSNIKLRRELKIKPESFMILFVGNLIPSRNILNLLEAVKHVSKENNNISLLIIGKGPQEKEVDEFINSNEGINIRRIHSIKFDELHKYYACANAYIHPGAEPYSLALVEAVIAELPIISTEEVGAVYDYVENDKNGILIKNNDINQLEEAILKVLENKINIEDLIYAKDYLLEERNPKWAKNQLIKAALD